MPRKTILMRLIIALALGVFLLELFQSTPAVGSAGYSLDWFTFDGGSGSSSGDAYTLNGTIGQAEAQPTPASAAAYSLQGGFWQQIAAPPDNYIYLPLAIR